MQKMPSPSNDPAGLPAADPIVPEVAAETEQAAAAAEQPAGIVPNPALEEQDLEMERKWAELQGLRQDIKARKRYARHIFRLIVVWLIAIFIILLLQGFLSEREMVLGFRALGSFWRTSIHFRLSDAVLLALIGGTTANVLGLFIFVVQYLFPKRTT
jgi:hypothetical protein